MPRHSLDEPYPLENENAMPLDDATSVMENPYSDESSYSEEDPYSEESSYSEENPYSEEDSLFNRSPEELPEEESPSTTLAPPSSPADKAPYYKPMAQTVTGNVVHASGEELARPVDFPRRYNIILVMLVIVAAIVGVFLFTQYYSNVINGAAKEQQLVEEYLARGVALDLPVLSNYVEMSDEEIQSSLQNAGYNIHDVSDGSTGLDAIKSPNDLTATEAAVLFSTGIDKLSPSDAAMLLNGFWRLDTNRTDGFFIRVRYVDFTSGDITSALTRCLADEKIDATTMTEQGEDSSGNTYMTGVISVNDANYQWRASAIPLSKVYDINLPSSSIYVGFKLTKIS